MFEQKEGYVAGWGTTGFLSGELQELFDIKGIDYIDVRG